MRELYKPRISLRHGLWITSLLGDDIFADTTLEGAFESALLVWRFQ